MRKTSVVLLIFAGCLLIGGLVTCAYASHLAKKNDTPLYDSTARLREDGARVYDFTDENVARVRIDVEGADVNILPSDGENSYVELFHFSTGSFDISADHGLLTITNQNGVSSLLYEDDEAQTGAAGRLLRFASSYNFQGLRYILKYNEAPEGEPVINVYLAASSPVKNIAVDMKTGSACLKNLPFSCDYGVTTVDGDISIEGMKTDSVVNLNASFGEISVNQSDISACYVKTNHADVTAAQYGAGMLVCDLSESNLQLSLTAKIGDYRRFIKTESGSITVDGTKSQHKRESTDTGFGYLQLVLTGNGSATLASGDKPADSTLGISVEESLIEKELAKLDDSLGSGEIGLAK